MTATPRFNALAGPFLAIAKRLLAEDNARRAAIRAADPEAAKRSADAVEAALIEQDEARNQAWSLGRRINAFAADDGAPA